MKKLMIYIGLIILSISVFTACEKNEQDKSYNDVNRINLSGDAVQFATADSTVIGLAVYPKDTTGYNLRIIATAMGEVSNVDRQFTLKVIPTATTALTGEYVLPSTFTIKAGKVSSVITVRVARAARLTNATAKLTLSVAENSNFQPGTHPTFTLIWTDQLTMPSNWSSVGFYFGKYSRVKHSLMVLSQPQYKDITLLSTNYSALFYIASASLDSLNRYNAANPGNPMKNEGGVVIGICSSCN